MPCWSLRGRCLGGLMARRPLDDSLTRSGLSSRRLHPPAVECDQPVRARTVEAPEVVRWRGPNCRRLCLGHGCPVERIVLASVGSRRIVAGKIWNRGMPLSPVLGYTQRTRPSRLVRFPVQWLVVSQDACIRRPSQFTLTAFNKNEVTVAP